MIYLLQVSICWIAFYLAYHFLMRKETFFHLNRYYLLGTLVLGLIVPLLSSTLPSSGASFEYAGLHPVIDYTALTANISTQSDTSSLPIWNILYSIGLGFMLLKLSYGLRQIWKYYQNGERIQQDHITMIYSDTKHLPFSFFNAIFLSKRLKIKGDIDQIILHEVVHARQYHSVDILFVELLHAIFWFNPILILYKKALKDSHEFIADAHVVQSYDHKNYSNLLLSHVNSGTTHVLTNQFFHSQIKKRIHMITTQRSPQWRLLKYALVLPLTVILLFSCNDDKLKPEVIHSDDFKAYGIENPPAPPPPPSKPASLAYPDAYKVVQEMPRFPGCEANGGTAEEKKQCAQKKMLQYIYSNLKYPAEARKNGIEGMSVLQFVVTKSGDIANITILRKPGGKDVQNDYGCTEAAKKVLESMRNLPEKWTPGKQNGQAVDVLYTIPVRFKLE